MTNELTTMRRVRRKVVQIVRVPTPKATDGEGGGDGDTVVEDSGSQPCVEEAIIRAVEVGEIDWTSLPNDILLVIIEQLNYRDRASLSTVCKAWRTLTSSPSLWTSLDLRAHTLDSDMASSLASRCHNLEKLKFRGSAGGSVIPEIQAKQLKELVGDGCKDLKDATLSMVVARHENLELLQLGPDVEKITGDAIKVVAMCCKRLRCLRLAGVRVVDRDSIKALVKHCRGLTELSLLDCNEMDELALGEVSSLKYLSIAGTRNVIWSRAVRGWGKLTNLVALDVSRTTVTYEAATSFLSELNLGVLCALGCPALLGANGSLADYTKDSIVLGRFTLMNGRSTDLQTGLAAITGKGGYLITWAEWMLSHALLRIADHNTSALDAFWVREGTAVMLRLIESAQEDVQERAATALATFVVVDDENATVDPHRAEAVMHGGGIRSLLNLAKSSREGVQSEAAKAIANLSVNAEVAKAVASEGGIGILAGLARSPNRWVAEEAAGGLWNLSVGEEHKASISHSGAIEALVDLASKWPAGGEGVLERAAGALANLAADDKCSMKVANAGGVHALVALARFCVHEGVQEQAARALANLAAHGDSNPNNAAVGREAGALEALVKLTSSTHEGVRQEAAGALWNLSFDDRNREAIALAGGVEALVTLARECFVGGCQALQERAAGALWGLSVSEENSIAICRVGGIGPLIQLARSEAEDVHETAAGALWNLAFNPGNALQIVEQSGLHVLTQLCASSPSKMARFMSALALAYMLDGRVDEYATEEYSDIDGVRIKFQQSEAMARIDAFVQSFSEHSLNAVQASQWSSSALQSVAESARIHEAGLLRCSGAEIGRFVFMLRHSSLVLRSCAVFALLQFTMPGGRHALHHANLLQKSGAGRVLRVPAASTTTPLLTRVFARLVLRNLEQCPSESLK